MSCLLDIDYVRSSEEVEDDRKKKKIGQQQTVTDGDAKSKKKVNELRLGLRYRRDDDDETAWREENFTLRR